MQPFNQNAHSVSTRLVPANIIHFDMNETSGASIVDEVAGLELKIRPDLLSTEQWQTGISDYAIHKGDGSITSWNGNDLEPNNEPFWNSKHTDGCIVFYYCVKFEDAEANGAASICHFIDSGAANNEKPHFIFEENIGVSITASIARKFPNLAGGETWEDVNYGGAVIAGTDLQSIGVLAYVLVVPLGGNPFLMLDDATVLSFELDILGAPQSAPTIPYWDFSGGYDIAIRNASIYVMGGLYLQETPTQADALLCAQFHKAQATLGFKGAWPGWYKYNAFYG